MVRIVAVSFVLAAGQDVFMEKPLVGTCSDLCKDGNHGTSGFISGTAPFCGGTCADCGDGHCYHVESGSVSDYGSGCASGNKVCCCSQNFHNMNESATEDDTVNTPKTNSSSDGILGGGEGCSTFVYSNSPTLDDCIGKEHNQGFNEACHSGSTCVIGQSCGWLMASGYKCCFDSYTASDCDWHNLAKTAEVLTDAKSNEIVEASDGGHKITDVVIDVPKTNFSNEVFGGGEGCSTLVYSNSPTNDDCIGKEQTQGFNEWCHSGSTCVIGQSCGWLMASGYKCCYDSYTASDCDWHN